MLLDNFQIEMFRPKCNPNFQSVHCVAHLEQDISEVLPYLNTEMGGGGDYVDSPPTLTLQIHGKLITLHAKDIFINALNDETEAAKIVNWLKKEINQTWDDRDKIQPTFSKPPAPKMIEILKLLPKTNCKKCGEPTCMVFALKLIDEVKEIEDCHELNPEMKTKLVDYLRQFSREL
ncbi:MAG: (Fe-S)-binding protein [Desulfomonilaceae bacterium]